MSTTRVLFTVLTTSTVLLAFIATPWVLAREGIWRTDWADPAASRLGPEVQISVNAFPECHRYRAAVAYNWNHDEYLVVWHLTCDDGTRAVYARRISASGQPLAGSFLVSYQLENQVHPAVAYNATDDEYLVVWMYDISGDGSRYDIRGRIIPWNCHDPGASSIIGNLVYPYDMWSPAVAWGNVHNVYMVTWDVYSATTDQPLSIAGRPVSGDGAPGTTVELTWSNSPHYSDVVYNAAKDEFLVVWVRSYSDIYGARLKWDGSITRGDFLINDGTVTQQSPAVTTNEQNRYLVVWEHQYDADDWDVVGQELDVNGNTVDQAFWIAGRSDDEVHPDVACNGATGKWLVVWQRAMAAGDAIWASHWDVGSRPNIYDDFQIALAAFWNNRYPVVACDIPGYFIAYEGRAADPTDRQHIYGRMWWPETVYLPLTLRNH